MRRDRSRMAQLLRGAECAKQTVPRVAYHMPIMTTRFYGRHALVGRLRSTEEAGSVLGL